MKTKYWYALLKRIRLGRAVLLVAAVSLSAIVVASAMRLDLTPSNNPGDSATGPQLNSSNQIVAASTTFVVNYLGDADDASPGNGVCATVDGDCTLRAAIREANARPGTDDINFDVGLTGTIPFGSGGGTYQITDDLSIQPHTGQARNLTIQSIGARVFTVNAGVTLLLTNMTITNGGSGGATPFSFGGGAIWNDRGRVFVYNVTFSANYSCSPVPTCESGRGHGGAIANSGYLEVWNSTFVNNVSPPGRDGGAIYNFADDTTGIIYNGSAVIVNSTFFGNRAGRQGGGILNYFGALTVINSTIAGNHAEAGGGIAGTLLTLRNTILAYNTAVNPATANCHIPIVDQGGNLSSDGSCPFTHPTSKSNTDPLLGPLQNNGGRTDTMALLPGSPAIDAGVPRPVPPLTEADCKDHVGLPLTYDQRYFPRPVDGDGDGIKICDSGAYELQAPPTTAHLKLAKEVTNDNGGTAIPTDFILSADGPTPISGPGGVESDVTPGTYTLSETGPSGYSASAWVCTGGTQNGSQITLALGQSATCTITNDDQAAHLKLVKDVTNDNGGTALPTDFILSADGPTPISGPGGAESDVTPGTYTLSETGPSGYSASAWVCVGGTQSGSQITLAQGQSATCTITNDDQAAHLKLVKNVTNDNGGTAIPTDFILSADGPTPISGPGGAESDVNAGTYNLSESGPSGYAASAWSCEGGSQSGSSITLAPGENVTCNIENNDQQAFITVVKDVINDDSGLAAPDDFNLTLDGNPVLSGVAVPVNPGTYTAGETLLPGYTFEGFSGDCNSNGEVTVALGESRTCTLTNNDIPAPPIKVTGGGQIQVPDPTSNRKATFGFNADQNEAGSTAATGHFNYVNHDTGLHINGSVNDIQVIALNPDGSPKTVQFSGTCDGPGPACTFIVTVEDNGEPGTSDEFGIIVTGEVTESQSQRVISKGNIQFHIR
jgi:CSLREA domain-containing protein